MVEVKNKKKSKLKQQKQIISWKVVEIVTLNDKQKTKFCKAY